MMRGRPDRQVLVYRCNLALGHLRGADSQSTKVFPGLWKIEGVLLGESRQDVMFYSTANWSITFVARAKWMSASDRSVVRVVERLIRNASRFYCNRCDADCKRKKSERRKTWIPIGTIINKLQEKWRRYIGGKLIEMRRNCKILRFCWWRSLAEGYINFTTCVRQAWRAHEMEQNDFQFI